MRGKSSATGLARLACAAAMIGLFASCPAMANEWPAKSFQPVARQPTPEEISGGREEISALDMVRALYADDENTQTAATKRAGSWVDKIGGYYRNAGHRPPALEPIVQDAGVNKYRFYIFPFSWSRTRWTSTDAGGTYEANTCETNEKISWLAINHDVNAGNLPKSNYWTISHELMHALMYGDHILANCNKNSFEVSEGIPEGAAAYLTNKEFRNYSGNLDKTSSAVGLRSYKLPFFYFSNFEKKHKSRLEKKTGYLTGSFWRFLAERFGGLSVFPHILKSPVIENATQEWMYRWLEDRLQTLPGLKKATAPVNSRGNEEPPGLFEVYPAFVTEFASYGAARYMGFAHRKWSSWQQARNVWLRQAFGGCRKISLDPGRKVDSITLDIDRNAAACLRVRFSGFKGNIRSQIEVSSKDLNKLGSLHLGWAWKIGLGETENCYRKRKSLNSKWPPCIYKVFAQTGPQIGNYVSTWPLTEMDFGQQEDGIVEWIYILSNVSVEPWNTVPANDLLVKVAVSSGNINDEPAEPVHQLPVARTKPAAAPNPIKPVDREVLYGLQTSPPASHTSPKGFNLIPYRETLSNGTRAKAEDDSYAVQLYQLEYGQTGPVTGNLVLHQADPAKTAQGVVSSALCKDGDKPIGEIIRSDEDAVQIKIDTDLCKAGPGTLKKCETACPVVDHVTAEFNIAYGWRQFEQTAPTDIRTRGIERYINTMPDSLAEAMTFGANTALPDTDDWSLDGSAGNDDGGAGTTPSGHSGATLDHCACSCEEMWVTDARGEEMKSAIEGGAELSMAELRSLTRCAEQCQSEYMICRFEADEAEKAEREEAKRQAANPENCDCSCANLAAEDERGAEMRDRFESGGQVVTQELQELMRCMPICQQARMGCMLKQQ